MNKVFIVILNWNQPQLTIECLKSVSASRIMNYELRIVIVDNASTDNSLAVINKFILHSSKYIVLANQVNLGYAGGNNTGLKYALKNKADYILILNNDTLVDPFLINRLIDAGSKYPKVGIFSPKIYFYKGFEFHQDRYTKNDLGKVIWSAGGKMDWDNVFGTNIGVDSVDKGQFNRDVELDFATGAAMFINSQALKEVGIFDEKYFMYFEDVDLSLRMIKRGWKIRYVPGALVWHKVAQSSGIGDDLNDYYITRNRLYFGLNNANFKTKIALVRESIKFIVFGRKMQKIGVRDYILGKFGKGSWE